MSEHDREKFPSLPPLLESLQIYARPIQDKASESLTRPFEWLKKNDWWCQKEKKGGSD